MMMRAQHGRTLLAGLVTAGMSLAMITAGTLPARAEQKAHSIAYKVWLAGIKVASASIDTVIEDGRYTMTSHVDAAGLAKVFVAMTAETHATGAFAEGKAMPASYEQDFRRGKKLRRYDVAFSGGGVKSFTIIPERKDKPDGWVEILPEHLKGVQDPLAAMIRPASASPCAGTVRVFDGEMRFDLELSGGEKGRFAIGPFDGESVSCKVRFRPVSGYRQGRSDIETVRKMTGITLTFARVNSLQAWVPVRMVAPTSYGKLTVETARIDP